ncbi:MAG: C2 family cysteine protease [Candidatus Sericytochromatia bacterium]
MLDLPIINNNNNFLNINKIATEKVVPPNNTTPINQAIKKELPTKDSKDISKLGKSLTNIEIPNDNLDFWEKAKELFKKLDINNNGFISRNELIKKTNDISIKGEDSATLAFMLNNFDKLKNVSNDKNNNKGITLEDLNKIKDLSEETKNGINLDFKDLKEKLKNNEHIKNEKGEFRLPEKASDINYKDIKQGNVGDCYFLAALTSLAKVNPQKIKDMIKDNGDGTYNVKFNNTSIKVNKPTDSELALYSTGSSWVPIIEKAYAVYRKAKQVEKNTNAYDATTSGDLHHGVKPFTSGSYETNNLSKTKENETRQKLIEAIKNNRIVTAGINDKNKYNLQHQHAYAVLDFDPKTNLVSIKNPWGNNANSKLHKENDAGIFQLPLNEFHKIFKEICYEKP